MISTTTNDDHHEWVMQRKTICRNYAPSGVPSWRTPKHKPVSFEGFVTTGLAYIPLKQLSQNPADMCLSCEGVRSVRLGVFRTKCEYGQDLSPALIYSFQAGAAATSFDPTIMRMSAWVAFSKSRTHAAKTLATFPRHRRTKATRSQITSIDVQIRQYRADPAGHDTV